MENSEVKITIECCKSSIGTKSSIVYLFFMVHNNSYIEFSKGSADFGNES